jgi:regulator of protease activity HflC (stomatin/prohibitin superfamily)
MHFSNSTVLYWFFIIFSIVVALSLLADSFFTVNTAQRAVVERFRKFRKIAGPGLSMKIPLVHSVYKVDMRVKQLNLIIETKTKDNVFVKIPVSVLYQVLPDKVFDAYYKLANPREQIESYVYNVILGHVPKMNLDDAFEQQGEVALAVKQELDSTMEHFGYSIVKALVTDIVPNEKVKEAMNDINAARREQEAALARGEADKTIAVKRAEAEAASKRLQGEGVAAQRKAIIDGLSESFEGFQKAVVGSSSHDVMSLVLLTQYLDTLKEIGGSAKTNTLLLPHSPGALKDLFSQIRDGVMTGDLVSSMGR